ncbi:hypothetical protein GWD52_01670 [Enterobacteriaceae bacterium 4M9]|nr:hypothetical protein [Enterobacteriaceae bacterium 4M9]
MIHNLLNNVGAANIAALSPEAGLAETLPGFAQLLESHLGDEAAAIVTTMPEMAIPADELAQQIRDMLEQGVTPDGLVLESGQVQQLQQWLAQVSAATPLTPQEGETLMTHVAADSASREATLAADTGLLLNGALKTTQAQNGSEAVALTGNGTQAATGGTSIPALVASALNVEKRRPGNEHTAMPETAALQAKAAQTQATDGARVAPLAQDITQPQAGASPEPSPLNAALLRLSPEGSATLPANALATASTNAAPVLSQTVGTAAWQQALSQQISMFTRNGIHNAELRLHPQDLGALQLNIRMNQDQAQVHIVSDNHQVRAALEAAMPQLRTSLAEAGIELSQSSVSDDNTAPWQEAASQANNDGEKGRGNGKGDDGLAQEDGENNAVETRTVMRPGGVDTFA